MLLEINLMSSFYPSIIITHSSFVLVFLKWINFNHRITFLCNTKYIYVRTYKIVYIKISTHNNDLIIMYIHFFIIN